MWSLRGFSLLRWPLLLLVTSLVFSGVFCSSSGAPAPAAPAPALCDIPCCSVLPTCDNAQLVTCDCPNIDAMTLRKGDIPETVRAVNILNIKHVTIDKDAINVLHSLTNFTLSGIDKLDIKQDGMASQNQSKLRSVTMQNVGSLQVESKAFSGVWQPKTSIRMHHISRLNVESNAFDYQVTESGPSVSLQHVGMLNLEPNGFAASIVELDVYNVTMEICHDGSFGGNTLHTNLNSVTIAEAETGCFDSRNRFATLNIQSLTMETAHTESFSGRIDELIIKNSHITTIHERGFDINVTKMQINGSYISEIHSNGLSVDANVVIRLEDVRIDDLRRNALSGLRAKKHLIIKRLEIVRAEDKSLALSESATLQISDMRVTPRLIPVCPTDKWARTLTGASPKGPLSNATLAVHLSLTSRDNCGDASSNVSQKFDSKPHSDPPVDHGHLDNVDDTYDTRRSKDVLSTADTLSAVEGPASASDGVSNESQVRCSTEAFEDVEKGGTNGAGIGNKDIHRTQVLTLAVVLLLAVVLIVVLLVLRYRRSRKPSNDQQSDLEKGVLLEVQNSRNDDHDESGGSGVQTDNTGGLMCCSSSPLVDNHHKQPFRGDLSDSSAYIG